MRHKSQIDIQERIPKIVHQLRIQAQNEQSLEIVKVVLLNLGHKENELVTSFAKTKPSLQLFNEDATKIQRFQKLFSRLDLAGVKVSHRRLLPKDWLTLWKTNWRPAPLTKKMDVVPVWYKDKYKPRRGCDAVFMDTLLSFGTGLHETTQFMAQFIENEQGRFKSFMDIGTGTGILGLMALKYGAQSVCAIDIGELSVQAARDNMRANQMYFNVQRADIGTYRSKKTYDFVAANLITEDLIEHKHKIIGFVKKNGLLAVSGISLENLNKLRAAFSSLPLKVRKVSKGKQWSGLLFQRKTL